MARVRFFCTSAHAFSFELFYRKEVDVAEESLIAMQPGLLRMTMIAACSNGQTCTTSDSRHTTKHKK